MNTDIPQTHAVIVAGGIGKRMGADRPKQFLSLRGRTILEWTLEPFVASKEIHGITIVAERDSMDVIREQVAQVSQPWKCIDIVEGGRERQDSVRNGIASAPDNCDIIIVHDAVRPFITVELIGDCIKGAYEHKAVTVMRPVKETVKEVRDGIVVATPDRSTLWITQTPQAFRADILREAHRSAVEDGFIGTDDCMLAERLGHAVHIIEGNDYNIKITTPADLAFAEAIAQNFEKRGT